MMEGKGEKGEEERDELRVEKVEEVGLLPYKIHTPPTSSVP